MKKMQISMIKMKTKMKNDKITKALISRVRLAWIIIRLNSKKHQAVFHVMSAEKGCQRTRRVLSSRSKRCNFTVIFTHIHFTGRP